VFGCLNPQLAATVAQMTWLHVHQVLVTYLLASHCEHWWKDHCPPNPSHFTKTLQSLCLVLFQISQTVLLSCGTLSLALRAFSIVPLPMLANDHSWSFFGQNTPFLSVFATGMRLINNLASLIVVLFLGQWCPSLINNLASLIVVLFLGQWCPSRTSVFTLNKNCFLNFNLVGLSL